MSYHFGAALLEETAGTSAAVGDGSGEPQRNIPHCHDAEQLGILTSATAA